MSVSTHVSDWSQQCAQCWQQALATPQFQATAIEQADLVAALIQAQQRCFGRLLQALLRERLLSADAFTWTDTHHAMLPLANGTLHFTALTRAPMSAWTLNGSVEWRHNGQCHTVTAPSVLLRHLQALLTPALSAAQYQRMATELDNSCLNDSLCLAYHQHWNTRLAQQYGTHWLPEVCRHHPQPTLLLEQWGTLGHPWHPNHKTRLGVVVADVIAWAPEFDAEINVVLAAVRRDCIALHTLAGSDSFEHDFRQHFAAAYTDWQHALRAQGLHIEDYLPLPLHPWQAQHYLPQAWVKAIDQQQLWLSQMPLLRTKPTMSFRTLVPQTDSIQPPMLKLPVSLRLTSVERTVSPRSAVMGPRISALLLRILAQEASIGSVLRIIPERHGMYFSADGVDDGTARHVAALYRDHPAACIDSDETALPLGALFADDASSKPLWAQWLRWGAQQDHATAALAWFAQYGRAVLHGTLGMYLRYGIAFEAHQQNSFVVLGPHGTLRGLLLRDFGDIRIHRPSLHAHGLDVALYDPAKTLFDDARFVREKFMHTVLICHLG